MGIGIGIGTAVMSFFGSAAAATAISTGVALTGGMAMAAGAIGGAIVGAAVGGLTAAVMGGDIGKGMLFGAVGGAVTGGISGYLAGPGTAIETAQASGAIPTTVHGGEISQNFMGIAKGTKDVATGAGGGGGWSSTLKESGKGLLKDVGGSVIAEGAKGVMAAWGAEDQREWDAEQAALAHERDLARIKLNSSLSGGAGADNTGAHLAYKARMAELDQRKVEFKANTEDQRLAWNTEQQRKRDRQELMRASGEHVQQTDPATGQKSIQEVRGAQNISGSTAKAPNETAMLGA